MTPERWKEIDRVFEKALELGPAARADYLEEACAGDPDLRKEVESLLTHDTDESVVGHPSLEEATAVLSRSLAEAAPKFIGRYRVVRSLGIGGMGQVFLAHDEQLNRPVAIKLLLGYDAAAPERVKRFRREALAASALNHPNILTIYEIGEDAGHHFIATEFVDGQTLQQLISRGPVSVAQAAEVAMQITGALAAAHAAGIVHRDIKPANIMMRADGLVKVLDFGVAKYDEPSPSKQSQIETAAGTVIGTAAYMSPEQARGLPLDPRTDLWSAGAILYELVTGVRPFQGETPLDTMAAIIEKPVAPFTAHAIEAPAALERIVLKALQKQRENRYASASELLADLKQLAKAVETSGAQPNPGPLPTKAEFSGSDSRSSSSSGGRVTAENTLAVLPFKPLVPTDRDEALELGMADTLITRLSGRDIIVRPISSVRKFVDLDHDPLSAGNQLQVASVLDGTIQRSGDRIRMTVRLISAVNGASLWSGTFDENFTDIFAVQDAISEKILAALSLPATGLSKRYTENPEAYELYLKGRYHFNKMSPADVQKSLMYFQEAIVIDPSYALAYVGLANAYRGLGIAGDRAAEFLPKSKQAAQRAVELDSTSADAHAVLGFTIFWVDWNWQQAERELKLAVDLNPNNADAHWFYGTLLSSLGRSSEALNEVKRARELDPLNLLIGGAEGQFLIHAGQPAKSLARLNKTIALEPNFWFAHMFAADAHAELGDFGAAIAEARRATEIAPNSHALASLGYALGKSGAAADARQVLERLLKLAGESHGAAHNVAVVYHGLGDEDEALAWLRLGVEQRDPRMVFLKVEPKWNDLRSDGRFEDLLKRLGFRS